MIDFIILTIIYTFSIFGIMVFVREMIFGYSKKNNCNTIILVYRKNDDFEKAFRESIYFIKSRGLAQNVYILFEDENDKNIEIAKKIAQKDNIFIVHNFKQIYEILYRKNIHNY